MTHIYIKYEVLQKSKKDKKKEWKLKKLTAAQMAELAAHLGNDEVGNSRVLYVFV